MSTEAQERVKFDPKPTGTSNWKLRYVLFINGVEVSLQDIVPGEVSPFPHRSLLHRLAFRLPRRVQCGRQVRQTTPLSSHCLGFSHLVKC